jgi:hypothetical protein
VTVQPGDRNAAAAGRGRLRASHADRERVVATLKIAFVQGMLTKDELDIRLGQTLASRTYADLAVLTADIPAGLADTPVPAALRREPARSPARNAAKFAACAAIGPGLVAAGAEAGSDLGRWLFAFAMVYLMSSIVAGMVMIDAWQQKRSSGQQPPGSAQRGHAFRGDYDVGGDDNLTQCEARPGPSARYRADPAAAQNPARSPATRRRPSLPAASRVTA